MSRRHLPDNFVVRDTYTVIRYLGSGAFGDVYQVRHRYMGIQAMKVIPATGSGDLFAEAFILTKVGHPNIIRVFEANEFIWEGLQYIYFTMEYVSGGTLGDYLTRINPDLATRQQMCSEIASGLSSAHSQNPPIIHRDLSPWNIMVATENGKPVVKISDFGLAKSVDLTTRLASAAGNFFYMPPEAFWGHESTASDVFSVALVMFEMMTGRLPFPVNVPSNATDEERVRLVRASRKNIPPKASTLNNQLNEEWDDFFDNALATDPAKRTQDGQQMQRELSVLLNKDSSPRTFNDLELRETVEAAMRASKQAISLPVAISLMERACRADQAVNEKYSGLLELWKRGIVQ
jgi:serine/threonine-protein kinase